MSHDHISCEEVIERLFDYLDRELDEDISAVIDRHIEHCRDCFTRAEFEKRLREKVAKSAQVEAPERLQRRLKGILSNF